MGEPVGDKRAELFSEFAVLDKSVAQRDESDRNLSGLGVATTDDSTLFYRRMFQQNGFDLGGSYGEAFVLNHFLAPIDDTVEAFTIAGDDVARPIPSITQHRGSGLWLFPVTEHELRTAHDELSRLAGRRFLQI